MTRHRFLVGHVLDALRALPSESVHCVVTSPPYWGLRDYELPPVNWPEVEYSPMPGLPSLKVPSWRGQLGLEPTPEMYVGHLVLVFREVRRVLRRDGTLWLNLGDTYAGRGGPSDEGRGLRGPGWTWYARVDGAGGFPASQPNRGALPGLKAKDLVGVPWRVAFALQADGWWLRSDVIWSKPNCLPESVKDRPTRSHEYVFLLAKSSKYFYDPESVKEPALSHLYDRRYAAGGSRDRTGELWNSCAFPKPHTGFKNLDTTRGRNRRSVWVINTEPFSGAHFAAFPRKLAEICVLAGTSPRACPLCGAPWRRVNGVEHDGTRVWEPACNCVGNDGSGRCVVLDPFGGSGTVALVAADFGRDSIYIDLKREYAEMALERCGFLRGRLFVDYVLEIVGLGGDLDACGLPGLERADAV